MCVDRKINRDWWCVDYFSSNFAQNVKKKKKHHFSSWLWTSCSSWLKMMYHISRQVTLYCRTVVKHCCRWYVNQWKSSKYTVILQKYFTGFTCLYVGVNRSCNIPRWSTERVSETQKLSEDSCEDWRMPFVVKWSWKNKLVVVCRSEEAEKCSTQVWDDNRPAGFDSQLKQKLRYFLLHSTKWRRKQNINRFPVLSVKL